MSPADRKAITRSIANLWTFQALFISRLLSTLEEDAGLSGPSIERLLQRLDAEGDEVLEGTDDQLFASSLVATVRAALAIRRGGN